MPTLFRKWDEARRGKIEQFTATLEWLKDPDILLVIHSADQLASDTRTFLGLSVQQARLEGATWEEIGQALGSSRQAAWDRFRYVDDVNTGASVSPSARSSNGRKA